MRCSPVNAGCCTKRWRRAAAMGKPRRPKCGKPGWLGFIVPPVVTFFLLMAGWELWARVKGQVFLLPGPLLVNEAAMENARTLARATLTTATAAGMGFLASVFVGV